MVHKIPTSSHRGQDGECNLGGGFPVCGPHAHIPSVLSSSLWDRSDGMRYKSDSPPKTRAADRDTSVPVTL